FSFRNQTRQTSRRHGRIGFKRLFHLDLQILESHRPTRDHAFLLLVINRFFDIRKLLRKKLFKPLPFNRRAQIEDCIHFAALASDFVDLARDEQLRVSNHALASKTAAPTANHRAAKRSSVQPTTDPVRKTEQHAFSDRLVYWFGTPLLPCLKQT